jgi:hypothetical protein
MKSKAIILTVLLGFYAFGQWQKAEAPTINPTSTSFSESLVVTFSHPASWVEIYYSISPAIWDSLELYYHKSIVISQTCTLKAYAMVECTGWCFSDTVVEYYSKVNSSSINPTRGDNTFTNNSIDAVYDLSGRILFNPQSSAKAIVTSNKRMAKIKSPR